ncbi:hypothetical protein [Rhodopseudomonas palustris]|uniref:Uncharacterized protein n=1 Tax=Rhodopseudomonas palustris (strain BisB18) TaxID=316056 RepID=Q20XF4_RHOPB
MNSFVTIRWLLAIVMIVGIAMAPLSRPAMADASSHGAIHAQSMVADHPAAALRGQDLAMDTIAMDTVALDTVATAEMASEMPCCPSQAPEPSGCDKCVAMINCMSSGFIAMPVALLQPDFVMPGNVLPRHADAHANGMGDSPPEHPPRTLV